MSLPDRSRPATVVAAVAILAALAVVQIGAYSRVLFQAAGFAAFPIVVTAVSLGAALVLLYALYAGHGWARIVILVCLALGIPSALLQIAATQTWIDGAWVGLSLAVSVGLMALLLSRSAREWYRIAR